MWNSDTALPLLVILLIVIGVACGLFVYPQLRRRHLERQPFPSQWLRLLEAELTVYKGMSPQEQQQLQRLIIRFVDSKRIVGCAGQQIDDRIRICIAAQACLLLLNRHSSEYSQLRTILVYPASFLVSHGHPDESGIVSEGHRALAGESWSNGRVILAWDDVEHGVRDFHDGHNVVLHEFAHQLDHESGVTNGAPLLSSSGAYRNWARVLSTEFQRLQDSLDSRMDSLIDEYGASDPAEFFAVITETFYERPQQMAAQHSELFQELMNYYRVDPRRWHEGST